MPRKWPSKKPFIKQHGIGNAHSGQIHNAIKPLICIGFVQAMYMVDVHGRHTGGQQFTGGLNHRLEPILRNAAGGEKPSMVRSTTSEIGSEATIGNILFGSSRENPAVAFFNAS